MSPIRLLILAVAAGAAVLAAVLMRNATRPPPVPVLPAAIEMPAPQVDMVNVLVARRDMLRGEMIVEGDLAWIEWPEDALNPLFINERDAPDAMQQFAGAAVRSEMYENEPVMVQRLVMKGETGYMAALVGPGLRAVAVEVSPETASGGFILPDDRVDVIVTYEVEFTGTNSGDSVTLSDTILENVRVLAIDQVFRQAETGPYAVGSVATLELSPEAAQTVALASKTGELSLTLRSFADAVRDGDAARTTDSNFRAMASPMSGKSGAISVVRNGETEVVMVGGTN